MAGEPISWKSRKQGSVALYTAEADYMTLSRAAQETGNEPEGPTTLLEENQSAITMANNPQCHCCVIDIRHHFIRERVNGEDIKLVYFPLRGNDCRYAEWTQPASAQRPSRNYTWGELISAIYRKYSNSLCRNSL